jgi:hypothetical protein
MTRTSVEELVEALRLRYVRARRDEKTCILNEFVAVTGYHRKAAIRRLRGGRRRKRNKRQGRPPVYTPDVVAALWEVWEICGRICSKRLAPFLPEAVALLEREGEVLFPADVRGRLTAMSPATIDRLLAHHRDGGRKGDAPPSRGRCCAHRFRCARLPTGLTPSPGSSRSTSSLTVGRPPPASSSTP